MSLTSFLEWAGCASGLAGACMLALNHRLSGWGFVAFLVSNALWIAFGLLTKAPGLVAMQIGFTATSLLGIRNWFGVKPRASTEIQPSRLKRITEET